MISLCNAMYDITMVGKMARPTYDIITVIVIIILQQFMIIIHNALSARLLLLRAHAQGIV